MAHPIPGDLDAAKALSSCPAALDLFMWISYRCLPQKGKKGFPYLANLVVHLSLSRHS
jgi:hypothetical protein